MGTRYFIKCKKCNAEFSVSYGIGMFGQSDGEEREPETITTENNELIFKNPHEICCLECGRSENTIIQVLLWD